MQPEKKTSTPVFKVGSITGANFDMWFLGMHYRFFFLTASSHFTASVPPKIQNAYGTLFALARFERSSLPVSVSNSVA